MFNALDEVKNVEFSGVTYCEEVGADLPTFRLQEPTANEWNEKAKVQNTKMFVAIMKREPISYEEVRNWMDSFVPVKKSYSVFKANKKERTAATGVPLEV